jgi:hypothetical protein
MKATARVILGDDEFAADLAYLHSLGDALIEHATPEHLYATCDGWPGYDFVNGSRFISGRASLDTTWIRRLGNRLLLAVFHSLYHGRPASVADSARSTVAVSSTWAGPRPASKSRR